MVVGTSCSDARRAVSRAGICMPGAFGITASRGPFRGGAGSVPVCAMPPKEHVFHVAGRPIPYWRFNEVWVAARTAAGLPGKFFHDLRRTAARNMVRGGAPEEIAMKVTGHRTRSMFNRYNIASLEDKLEALKKARAYAQSRARVTSNVTPITAGKSNASSTRAAFVKEMAEACGSRTHPSRSSRDADGFEVREGHRAPCASARIMTLVLAWRSSLVLRRKRRSMRAVRSRLDRSPASTSCRCPEALCDRRFVIAAEMLRAHAP